MLRVPSSAGIGGPLTADSWAAGDEGADEGEYGGVGMGDDGSLPWGEAALAAEDDKLTLEERRERALAAVTERMVRCEMRCVQVRSVVIGGVGEPWTPAVPFSGDSSAMCPCADTGLVVQQ
jgi:hypothetical protein